MTKGILICAFNNEEIDYISMSSFAAKAAKKHLNVPVAVLTDNLEHAKKINLIEKQFDYILEASSDLGMENIRGYRNGSYSTTELNFKNYFRSKIYDLSPFDETIVIDSDFIIFNDDFSHCWDHEENFLIYKTATDISPRRITKEFKRINDYSVEFYWATVFFFRKCDEAKVFFDLINHIQENWNFYRLTYNIKNKTFRNDFAFSIAIHIINGFSNNNWPKSMPGKMFYSLDVDVPIKIDDDSLTSLIEDSENQGDYFLTKIKNLNVHIMNKFKLVECLKDHDV
jgi:hypothetical protein